MEELRACLPVTSQYMCLYREWLTSVLERCWVFWWPGDADAMQASLLNYYLKRIQEVRLCNAFCCMPAALLMSASATIDITAPNLAV